MGINGDKEWIPEHLGQFLKINRSFFANRDENMSVVSALKSFSAKVKQDIYSETSDKGDRTIRFKQAVDSNIPEKFKLKIPIFIGSNPVDIDVETYATIDGTNVSIQLQSAGANDVIEDVKAKVISDTIEKIRSIAPEIAIIEQ